MSGSGIPDLRGTGFIAPAALLPRPPLAQVLSAEGFRLFFALAALHGAAWPLLWVGLWRYDLPLAQEVAPAVWHQYEMIFGAFGAALIGFLSTAIPEWVDRAPPKGRVLWGLAGLWGLARVFGFLGVASPVAMACDQTWAVALLLYVLSQKQARLLGFCLWLAGFCAAMGWAHWAMRAGDSFAAAEAVQAGGLVFLGLLGLALARITVPVTNLVLDPSETSSPYRPHPGRANLAAGLVALVLVGRVLGLSAPVQGWLLLAAGAGFMDRMAEGFIGRAALRAEILVLSLPAGLAGLGLLWLGASALGAPLSTAGGWHLVLMGGMGLAVLGVMSIAGLFHTGHALPFGGAVKVALALLLLGTALRLAPELELLAPWPAHLAASLLWAGGFALWLRAYWPKLRDPATLGQHEGC